ncbi:hypothetical protein EW026_g420 [Hermanssonia centrifuga]|uniref:DUF6534 domain-containing protein n=1 Tax=Hermanssonia centrifuga TaxID=98765 RepID=A0A4S4KUL9_9APHY|nr:hypothetical protein EW026_g420 [Hermanssonia centrifuga]
MSTLIAPPSLNPTLGTVFLANILAAILYGITSLQTYIYYRCNQDGKVLKALATVLICAISDFIVRGIFAYRIWRLSSFKFNWILILTLGFFSLVPIPPSIVLTVECVLDRSFTQLFRFSWAIYTVSGGGLIADIILASTLCVMLSKRRTGFKRTDSVIHTLRLYSISTGALTAYVSV